MAQSVKRNRRAQSIPRHRLRLLALPSMQELKGLLLLGGLYLLGSLLGVAFAGALEAESLTAIRDYVERFCDAANRPADWYALLWLTFRWSLLVLALRFTVLGAVLLPAVLCVKGFLLSFAISAFVRSFALRGAGAALLVFALPELAQTAILLMLALDSWRCAVRNGEPLWAPGELRHCAFGLLVLTASALAQSAGEHWLARGLQQLLL